MKSFDEIYVGLVCCQNGEHDICPYNDMRRGACKTALFQDAMDKLTDQEYLIDQLMAHKSGGAETRLEGWEE